MKINTIVLNSHLLVVNTEDNMEKDRRIELIEGIIEKSIPYATITRLPE
jgi:hypothetical protein